jgi:hypothetical protein
LNIGWPLEDVVKIRLTRLVGLVVDQMKCGVYTARRCQALGERETKG